MKELSIKEQHVLKFFAKESYATSARILFQCNLSPSVTGKITKATLTSLVKRGLLKMHEDSCGIGNTHAYSLVK